ncbi:MAG: MFS transporter [Porticoccaceae bacterium]
MIDRRTTGLATPWFHGWNIVAVAFLVQVFAVGLSTSVYGVYIDPMGTDLGASRFTSTLGFALLMAGLGVTSPIAGRLIERGSIRNLIVIGFIVLAASLLLLSLANHIFQVLIIYGVLIATGATLAGALPASTLVTNWFYSLRGRALGISTIGASAGGLLLPPVAALLIENFDWRVSFQVLAVACLIITLPIVWLVVANRPEDKGLHVDGAAQPVAPTPGDVRVEPALSMMGILRSRAFWGIALCVGLGNSVTSGVMVNIVPHAADMGHSPVHAAYLISVFTVGLVAGKLLIGAASDRFGLGMLWQVCLTMTGLGIVFLMYSASLPALIFACCLAGIGSGGYYPLMGMSIASSFPIASFSKVMGLVLPVLYLLAAPAAPLAGLVSDLTGSYSSAMWAALALLLIAGFIMRFVGGTRMAAKP